MADWEFTCVVLQENEKLRYKVLRRCPALGVCETKFFSQKEEAELQLLEWLQ